MQRPKVYIASPLVSLAERTTNLQLSKSLEKYCDVFLPQRDGELVTQLILQGVSREDAYKVVFRRDIDALMACDAVVVNLDGRSVDEGAAFELGFAHAQGKVCVGYRTDVRVLLPWGLNPMIEVPLQQTFGCIENLEDWAKAFSAGLRLTKPR